MDFDSPSKTCDDWTDYPIDTRGTFGGLMDNRLPLVCGGPDTQECFHYLNGKWEVDFKLNFERYHSESMASSPYNDPSHTFYVVGSLGAINYFRNNR